MQLSWNGTEASLVCLPAPVVVVVPLPLVRLWIPSSGLGLAFCFGAVEDAMII